MTKDIMIKKVSVLILLLLLSILVYYFTKEHNIKNIYTTLKHKYNTTEPFENMTGYTANDIYRSYVGGMPSIKELKDNIPSSNVELLNTHNSTPNINTQIKNKCLDSENIFNTLGYLAKNTNKDTILSINNGSNSNNSSNNVNGNVKMLKLDNGVEKIRFSRWKLIEGLLSPEYVSFYNVDNDCYLGRLSNGTLHCLNIELSNILERGMCSFKLVDGLVDKYSVSLLCASIHKEHKDRLVMVNDDNTLSVIKLEDIMNKSNKEQIQLARQCQFMWVDIKTNKSLIKNKHHLLSGNNSGSDVVEGFSSHQVVVEVKVNVVKEILVD